MARRPARQLSVIAALVSALAFAMGVKAWDQARARSADSRAPGADVATTPMQMWPVPSLNPVSGGPIRLAQVNGSGSSSPAGLGTPGSNQGGVSAGNPSGVTNGTPNRSESPMRNESLGEANPGNATSGGAAHLPSGQNPAATGGTSATGAASPGAAPTGSGK